MSTTKSILKANAKNLQTLSTLASENPELRNSFLYKDLLIRIDFLDFLCGKR